MESFEEKKPIYTHENPCGFCGYPVAVSEHNPDWCENAKEDLGAEEITEEGKQKVLTNEEFLAKLIQGQKEEFMDSEKEVPAVETELKIKKIEKPAGKEKELPPRLQNAITEINDWLKEATRVTFSRNFKEKLKEILVKNEIRVPIYQWEALKKIEAPPFAQDLLEKFKENWHNEMKIRGIL